MLQISKQDFLAAYVLKVAAIVELFIQAGFDVNSMHSSSLPLQPEYNRLFRMLLDAGFDANTLNEVTSAMLLKTSQLYLCLYELNWCLDEWSFLHAYGHREQ